MFNAYPILNQKLKELLASNIFVQSADHTRLVELDLLEHSSVQREDQDAE